MTRAAISSACAGAGAGVPSQHSTMGVGGKGSRTAARAEKPSWCLSHGSTLGTHTVGPVGLPHTKMKYQSCGERGGGEIPWKRESPRQENCWENWSKRNGLLELLGWEVPFAQNHCGERHNSPSCGHFPLLCVEPGSCWACQQP